MYGSRVVVVTESPFSGCTVSIRQSGRQSLLPSSSSSCLLSLLLSSSSPSAASSSLSALLSTPPVPAHSLPPFTALRPLQSSSVQTLSLALSLSPSLSSSSPSSTSLYLPTNHPSILLSPYFVSSLPRSADLSLLHSSPLVRSRFPPRTGRSQPRVPPPVAPCELLLVSLRNYGCSYD